MKDMSAAFEVLKNTLKAFEVLKQTTRALALDNQQGKKKTTKGTNTKWRSTTNWLLT